MVGTTSFYIKNRSKIKKATKQISSPKHKVRHILASSQHYNHILRSNMCSFLEQSTKASLSLGPLQLTEMRTPWSPYLYQQSLPQPDCAEYGSGEMNSGAKQLHLTSMWKTNEFMLLRVLVRIVITLWDQNINLRVLLSESIIYGCINAKYLIVPLLRVPLGKPAQSARIVRLFIFLMLATLRSLPTVCTKSVYT